MISFALSPPESPWSLCPQPFPKRQTLMWSCGQRQRDRTRSHSDWWSLQTQCTLLPYHHPTNSSWRKLLKFAISYSLLLLLQMRVLHRHLHTFSVAAAGVQTLFACGQAAQTNLYGGPSLLTGKGSAITWEAASLPDCVHPVSSPSQDLVTVRLVPNIKDNLQAMSTISRMSCDRQKIWDTLQASLSSSHEPHFMSTLRDKARCLLSESLGLVCVIGRRLTLSSGVLKMWCRATVSSTTPNEAPRCPVTSFCSLHDWVTQIHF